VKIDSERVDSLLERYAINATDHSHSTEAGDYEAANRAHEVVATIYRELRRRGPNAQRALLALLESPEPGVRSWAGAHALEFSSFEGERALIALANGSHRTVSLTARITLQEWRNGKLRFP
jgi:hypothetical protein